MAALDYDVPKRILFPLLVLGLILLAFGSYLEFSHSDFLAHPYWSNLLSGMTGFLFAGSGGLWVLREVQRSHIRYKYSYRRRYFYASLDELAVSALDSCIKCHSVENDNQDEFCRPDHVFPVIFRDADASIEAITARMDREIVEFTRFMQYFSDRISDTDERATVKSLRTEKVSFHGSPHELVCLDIGGLKVRIFQVCGSFTNPLDEFFGELSEDVRTIAERTKVELMLTGGELSEYYGLVLELDRLDRRDRHSVQPTLSKVAGTPAGCWDFYSTFMGPTVRVPFHTAGQPMEDYVETLRKEFDSLATAMDKYLERIAFIKKLRGYIGRYR